jgi:hypothetical protein
VNKSRICVCACARTTNSCLLCTYIKQRGLRFTALCAGDHAPPLPPPLLPPFILLRAQMLFFLPRRVYEVRGVSLVRSETGNKNKGQKKYMWNALAEGQARACSRHELDTKEKRRQGKKCANTQVSKHQRPLYILHHTVRRLLHRLLFFFICLLSSAFIPPPQHSSLLPFFLLLLFVCLLVCVCVCVCVWVILLRCFHANR